MPKPFSVLFSAVNFMRSVREAKKKVRKTHLRPKRREKERKNSLTERRMRLRRKKRTRMKMKRRKMPLLRRGSKEVG